jgi:hypothetical protein
MPRRKDPDRKTARDKQGNVIDPTSHRTHAMNPIDRARYDADEFEQPPARHKFRCMFCGALGSNSCAP